MVSPSVPTTLPLCFDPVLVFHELGEGDPELVFEGVSGFEAEFREPSP